MRELTGSLSSGVTFEESEQLVVRLKEGDETAFEQLFILYKDLVYTLAFRLLADKTEAMDVAQDVFLTLFRKIHSFRGDASIKTWLYRVTLNQASNRNRWWKRRFRDRTLSLKLARNGKEGDFLDLPSRSPEPDRSLYSREIQEALSACLKRLSFEQRVAVVLREVEGLAYEEIAEITGVQVGTVRSRIARGRERLRQLLREYQEGRTL